MHLDAIASAPIFVAHAPLTNDFAGGSPEMLLEAMIRRSLQEELSRMRAHLSVVLVICQDVAQRAHKIAPVGAHSLH